MGYWAKDGSYMHDEYDMNINVREGVPRGSGIIEESEYDKRRREEAKRQADKEYQEEQEIKARKRENERREKECEVADIMRDEVFESYRKQSWFKKFFAKRKGNDPYSKQDEIWKQFREQARAMSNLELDDVIRRGRIR